MLHVAPEKIFADIFSAQDNLDCLDFPDKLKDAGFNVISDYTDFSNEMDNRTINRYGIDKGVDFF